jgi:aconitate hydratase
LEVRADAALLSPGALVSVTVRRGGNASGVTSEQSFMATAAIETALEVDLLSEGGILPYILRRSLREPASP